MTTIQKVALAGAAGNLGPAILNALRDAGFEVTVLTRADSKSTFPEGVSVARVDYDSVEGLTSVLSGQDAVITTLGPEGSQAQLNLVEAASKAGVKRFIPSEFGSNVDNPKVHNFPVFASKVAVDALLEEKAKTTDLSYTLIRNGVFLDWGIMVGFMINLREKKVNLVDGGEHRFTTTTLPTVAKAVVAVLKKPEETKNKVLYIRDTETTMKEILAKAKKAVGEDGWTETALSVDELVAGAWAELKQEKPNPAKFVFPFLQAAIWGGDAYGSAFPNVDNELLGIKDLTDDEVQAIVDRYAK
ncbi:NAD(P)-binding protein [Thozetella sp. PMI_491]|nr:NAD(P)-binding protein [Thozetella sp. PMI_491]